jgi:AcrR family transcriptional regulator
MSPRTRKASDEQVFEAAFRMMSRTAPAKLTLGAIAAEAGLTPAALVQRFGSKRGLLLTLAEKAADAPKAMFKELRAAHQSPLAALREYASCLAGMGSTPGALAHNLGYLQVDLTDPDFHRHTRAMAVATAASLRDLLDAAVTVGELAPGTDTAALTRLVQALLSGSLISWAFYRDGTAEKWMLEDLESLLRPHLRPARIDEPRLAVSSARQRGRGRSDGKTRTAFHPERRSGNSRRRRKPG